MKRRLLRSCRPWIYQVLVPASVPGAHPPKPYLLLHTRAVCVHPSSVTSLARATRMYIKRCCTQVCCARVHEPHQLPFRMHQREALVHQLLQQALVSCEYTYPGPTTVSCACPTCKSTNCLNLGSRARALCACIKRSRHA